MLPLISCIIPVYNAEKYLARCLESVLAQTYANMEVVLIDDGSTDASRLICDTYAKAYGNILVHHIPNGGASLARKRGIERAQGEYVCFVDSDDFVAPTYVSTLYDLTRKHNTRLSACAMMHVREGQPVPAAPAGKDELLAFDQLMPRFFKYEYWGFWGGLYPRTVFQNLHFPKATLSEDYYVKTQLFCQERQMAVTSAPLYYYEQHPQSLSHTRLSERAFEEFENVLHVYEMTRNTPPLIGYAPYALSNVVETCVKLYSSCLRAGQSRLAGQRRTLRQFLRNNKRAIAACEPLNRKVKVIALCYASFPFFISKLINKML